MNSKGFQQTQKTSQGLVPTPQLQNSLKILRASTMELRSSVFEELQANPVLEELPPVESVQVDESKDLSQEHEIRSEEELQFNANDFSALEKMSEAMREQFAEENSGPTYSTQDAERREHFMDSLTESTSLQKHLMDQVKFTDCSDPERKTLLYLIGSLDDNGYLTEPISSIARNVGVSESLAQKALTLLKTFDPAGIGARHIQECLAIQLELKGRGNSLAAGIVRDHFDLLTRRKIPDLKRKTGTDAREIQQAIEEIATLKPAPGRQFAYDHNTVIHPDVIVYKDEYDEWQVQLNQDDIPRLRISHTYKSMLAKGTLSPAEKKFMQERMRSGKLFIQSIEQRRKTIERITREILEFQNDFFRFGLSGLRPLTLKTIAEAVGMHEATISRTVANKFIRTPHGIFPLKYFFASGRPAGNAESVSDKSIKDKIRQIIRKESSAHPFSDQNIADRLKEKGIRIARRTVAKYREELGISTMNLRRRYD